MRRKLFTSRKGFVPPNNTPYRYRTGSHVDVSLGYHPHFSTRFRNWGAKAPLINTNRELPELYLDRSECCGCTACTAICPQGAITMEPDEEGFAYPVVDVASCVCCRKCEDICFFKAALISRWRHGND